MNAQNLRAHANRFAVEAFRGSLPFVSRVAVEEFFDGLRADPPTARRLVGRLRDEANGSTVIRRWLLAIADVFDAAVELAAAVVVRRRHERRARERRANRRLVNRPLEFARCLA